MKNILAENMKRFGTKNLHEQLQENFHKNADTEAYRVILDLLVSMSDTDEETVQTAVEAANKGTQKNNYYGCTDPDYCQCVYRCNLYSVVVVAVQIRTAIPISALFCAGSCINVSQLISQRYTRQCSYAALLVSTSPVQHLQCRRPPGVSLWHSSPFKFTGKTTVVAVAANSAIPCAINRLC